MGFLVDRFACRTLSLVERLRLVERCACRLTWQLKVGGIY